jgi:hypothetical protein
MAFMRKTAEDIQRERYQDQQARAEQQERIRRERLAKNIDTFSAERAGVDPAAVTPGSQAQKDLIQERARQSLRSWGAQGNHRWNDWEAPQPPAPPQQPETDPQQQLIQRLDWIIQNFPGAMQQAANMGAWAAQNWPR